MSNYTINVPEIGELEFDDFEELGRAFLSAIETKNLPVKYAGDYPSIAEATPLKTSTLERWIDDVENEIWRTEEEAALFFLLSCCGYDLDSALSGYKEVALFQGNDLDAAKQMFNELHSAEIPEHLRNYVDHEAYAVDLRAEGSLIEFEYDGETWTCTNGNSL